MLDRMKGPTLKSRDEIAVMDRANRIVVDILEMMREMVKPGVTTAQMNAMAEEELAKRGGGSAVLATVPGIWMVQNSLGGSAMPRIRADNGGTCSPDFIVDGMIRFRMDGWELNLLLRAAHRVEVYTRRMLVPSEFASLNGCGAIVIWTM